MNLEYACELFVRKEIFVVINGTIVSERLEEFVNAKIISKKLTGFVEQERTLGSFVTT
jgi:hypothetical protein